MFSKRSTGRSPSGPDTSRKPPFLLFSTLALTCFISDGMQERGVLRQGFVDRVAERQGFARFCDKVRQQNLNCLHLRKASVWSEKKKEKMHGDWQMLVIVITMTMQDEVCWYVSIDGTVSPALTLYTHMLEKNIHHLSLSRPCVCVCVRVWACVCCVSVSVSV